MSDCGFDGCGRPIATVGYCRAHALQLYRRRDPALLTPLGKRRPRSQAPATCTGPGCDRPGTERGHCSAHAKQRRRDPGRPLRPLGTPRNPAGRPASKPAPAAAAAAEPSKPKPVKAPASRLPAGWDKPAPKPTPAPKRAGGTSESTLLYMTPVVPPTPGQVEAVLALIADEPDADLLANILGLAAA